MELAAKGIEVDLEELIRTIAKRDRDDSGREISPLCKPEDALELDTTSLTIAEQVEWIVRAARQRGAGA